MLEDERQDGEQCREGVEQREDAQLGHQPGNWLNLFLEFRNQEFSSFTQAHAIF